MKLFIPPLGTKLKLLKAWQFELHCEDRNKTLWDIFGFAPMKDIMWKYRRGSLCTVTLSRDDTLTVDRIFIRKGSKEYDSITFRGNVKHNGVCRKCRFWVKLNETLNLDVEVVVP